MLRLVDLTGGAAAAATANPATLAQLVPRATATDVAEVRATVAEVLTAVREEGDAAVLRYAKAFDAFEQAAFEVSPGELRAALDACPRQVRRGLETMRERVRWFAERDRPRDWTDERDGMRAGVRWQPVRRAGVCVPGGVAPLASSAVMGLVPAQVAGVDETVVVTPPGRDGHGAMVNLAAAALCGADRVLRVGGAQAVAALAFGTESVPACDVIVGPGNAYVAEAKAQAAGAGACGIDGVAGTTEVMVLADETADVVHVATALVGQAEHDPRSPAILVTTSTALAEALPHVLEAEVAVTHHRERVATALEEHGALVLVDRLDEALAIVDAWGPEHLEVLSTDARAVAARVRAAGCVFVGPRTPVPVGDYGAGPNHTLPTGGTARFRGGLRPADFMVPVNHLELDDAGLRAMAPVVGAVAPAEDLPAHVRATEARRPSGSAQGAGA